MKPLRAWLLVWVLVVHAAAAHAAEVGVATLVEGKPLVLRGVTWYRLVPGARVEDGDIIEAGERAQVQIEFTAGNALNLAGTGSLYLSRPAASTTPGSPTLTLPRGWLKVATNSPEMRVRTTTTEIVTTNAVLVLRATGPSLELFIESGTARLIEFLPNGAAAAARDVKRGEFWATQPDRPLAPQSRAPKAFVDAIPRHFIDALPQLAGRFASAPALTADHDITYAEAEPWLNSRDRALFEKRFTSRLRDPAFRKAVEPHLARYTTWDRKLHPEKYAPRHDAVPPARKEAP